MQVKEFPSYQAIDFDFEDYEVRCPICENHNVLEGERVYSCSSCGCKWVTHFDFKES